MSYKVYAKDYFQNLFKVVCKCKKTTIIKKIDTFLRAGLGGSLAIKLYIFLN